MTTIIIPGATRGEKLIAIPRKEYEEYLNLRNVFPIVKMTAGEKIAWKRAKKEYAQKKYVTLEGVQHELGLVSK